MIELINIPLRDEDETLQVWRVARIGAEHEGPFNSRIVHRWSAHWKHCDDNGRNPYPGISSDTTRRRFSWSDYVCAVERPELLEHWFVGGGAALEEHGYAVFRYSIPRSAVIMTKSRLQIAIMLDKARKIGQYAPTQYISTLEDSAYV